MRKQPRGIRGQTGQPPSIWLSNSNMLSIAAEFGGDSVRPLNASFPTFGHLGRSTSQKVILARDGPLMDDPTSG